MMNSLSRVIQTEKWNNTDKIFSLDVNLTKLEHTIQTFNVSRDDDNSKQLIDQIQRVVDLIVKNNIIDETMEFEAYEAGDIRPDVSK